VKVNKGTLIFGILFDVVGVFFLFILFMEIWWKQPDEKERLENKTLRLHLNFKVLIKLGFKLKMQIDIGKYQLYWF